jgi:predicted GNAT superfamily acetyltransferase
VTIGRTARSVAAPVTVRELRTVDEFRTASELLAAVWEQDPGSRQVTVSLLRALSMTDNYVAAAYDGEQMVGASVGFRIGDRNGLHSHITGVDRRSQARNIGFTLKSHQRDWAAERGIDVITWTFDPLVRRNAHFGLVKLGARATAFLRNVYGPMDDALNNGDESDRLVLEWSVRPSAGVPEAGLDDDPPPLILVDADGRPAALKWSGGQASVLLPSDIEGLRVQQPTLAKAWRAAVRSVLEPALSSGAEIVAFDREHGYVLRPRGGA